MRGLGWGIIGLLVAAGWLLQAIGETAFTWVVGIAVGVFFLAQVVELLTRMGLLRAPPPLAPGQLRPEDELRWQRSRRRRERGVEDLLAAVDSSDAGAIERLVTQENVSPFESGSFQKKQWISAHSLAKERGYQEGVKFFEAWRDQGRTARMVK
jgi:hypothetical protein